MVQIDNSDVKRLVQELRSESVAYYRQFVVWLGVGSAGAEIAVFSLAIRLPDLSFALHVLLPSLWAFLIGILAAALSVLFASFSTAQAGEHFAESHNRDEFKRAANALPQMFSSPQRAADEANQERNGLIDRANKSHESAERAWLLHLRWMKAKNTVVAISASAFLIGMAWPVGYITFGGRLSPA